MFLITGPTYPECVTEKLVKLVSLSLTQYSQSVRLGEKRTDGK